MRIARVVSGGQTGVDRAALDAAIAQGRSYGGWCPAGGWAEDLVEPPGLLARYPGLREATSADPFERTRLNVRDSQATLVVSGPSVHSPGTDRTVEEAIRLGRPYVVVDAGARGSSDDVSAWLESLGQELTLNVAGPRESEQPGAYRAARALLDEVLRADR